jgi:hypothetical protein
MGFVYIKLVATKEIRIPDYFNAINIANTYTDIKNNVIYTAYCSYGTDWKSFIKENEEVWIIELKKWIRIKYEGEFTFITLEEERERKLEKIGI